MGKKSRKKIWLVLAVVAILLAAVAGYAAWKLFRPAVTNSKTVVIKFRHTDRFSELPLLLHQKAGLKDTGFFKFMCARMKYTKFYPFVLSIKPGTNMVSLIRSLRAGKFQTVNVTIKEGIGIKETVKILSEKLEPTEEEFMEVFSNQRMLLDYGFTDTTLYAMFIPNTYNVYYNRSAQEVLAKFVQDYSRFWDSGRRVKAGKLGLDPITVSTLASIVCKETNMATEMPTIAGVYLNRLDKGMKLQADPTVAFSRGYGGRITKPSSYPSPYNTYIHYGLPPGPICIPSLTAIESVLNAEQHKYIYFCAKEDFSGYHNFAENDVQHSINARKWQAALDKQQKK